MAAAAKRKQAALPVEHTPYGCVQRHRFCHPDLHHEEVLELDSPFASAVAAGTHVFSFVLLGDQNAGSPRPCTRQLCRRARVARALFLFVRPFRRVPQCPLAAHGGHHATTQRASVPGH